MILGNISLAGTTHSAFELDSQDLWTWDQVEFEAAKSDFTEKKLSFAKVAKVPKTTR